MIVISRPCPEDAVTDKLAIEDPRRDPVVEAVRADLLRRSQLGIAKYGTTLGASGLTHRQLLQHAYEEALDLANCLKGAMMEMDGDDLSD